MAAGDPFLFEVAKRALLLSLRDPEAIVYRQQVLDRLPGERVRRTGALRARRRGDRRPRRASGAACLRDSPRTLLSHLGAEDGAARRLSQAAARDGRRARRRSSASPGFTRFFAMLARGARRGVLRAGREPPEGAQVQGRDADQRAAGRRQQGQRLHAPPAARAELARAGVRSLGLQLHDSRPRRERLQGARGARGQRGPTSSPTRWRSRSSTCSASSSCCASRSGSTSAA